MDASTPATLAPARIIGFSESEVDHQLHRLLRAGYKVRAQKLDGFGGRYRLLVAYPHNPGVEALIYWPEELTGLCVSNYHLPLSASSPVADFRADGSYPLPGVR